ncbi:MAG TPA: hypothetical protein VKU86_12560, partial [Acidimicrobiales bacterium]|nr:hypothetical protein [Acidimicrobiales bacterium]
MALPGTTGSAGTSGPAGARGRMPAWVWKLRLPRQPMIRHLVLAVAGGAVLFGITSVVGSYDDYQVAQIGFT